MTHKKRCTCGFIVSATSAKTAGEAMQDHCNYAGHDAIQAKNI